MEEVRQHRCSSMCKGFRTGRRLEFCSKRSARPLPDPRSSGPSGQCGAGGTQAPRADEGSQRLDRRACVQLFGGGIFFGVQSGGCVLNCVGRKWDPAFSRVGIGRTAALRGVEVWKAGAHSVGIPRLSCEMRADYCICVAEAAHKMAAGRRRGREEVGGPSGSEGKGSLAAPLPRRFTSLPRRAGAGARGRTLLHEEPLDAVALGRGTRTALWQGRGGPFPTGAGPAESRQPSQPEEAVVREHRGGSNRSHRAWKRGGRA